MKSLKIKFYRTYEGDIPSYGNSFNQILDQLVGGTQQWDTNNSHGVAFIPTTNIHVQRYESGPEIVGLILTLAPAFIEVLTDLIVAWLQSHKKTKKEERTIKLTVGGCSYEGPIMDKEELSKIISLLSENKAC